MCRYGCGSVVVHVLCVCMCVIVRVYLSAGGGWGGETTICPLCVCMCVIVRVYLSAGEGGRNYHLPRGTCCYEEATVHIKGFLPPPCLLHHAPPPMYTFVQGVLG